MDMDELVFYGHKNGIEVLVTEPDDVIDDVPIKYRISVIKPQEIGLIYFDEIGSPLMIRDGFIRRDVKYEEWCDKYLSDLKMIVPPEILSVLFDENQIYFDYMDEALRMSEGNPEYIT